jgi:hypothetical protein
MKAVDFFDSETCLSEIHRGELGAFERASEREWLVTNGLGDALVEKRIIMPQGENTTLVRFRVLRASSELRLTLRPLRAHRDYHSHIRGGWDSRTSTIDAGFRIEPTKARNPISCVRTAL